MEPNFFDFELTENEGISDRFSDNKDEESTPPHFYYPYLDSTNCENSGSNLSVPHKDHQASGSKFVQKEDDISLLLVGSRKTVQESDFSNQFRKISHPNQHLEIEEEELDNWKRHVDDFYQQTRSESIDSSASTVNFSRELSGLGMEIETSSTTEEFRSESFDSKFYQSALSVESRTNESDNHEPGSHLSFTSDEKSRWEPESHSSSRLDEQHSRNFTPGIQVKNLTENITKIIGRIFQKLPKMDKNNSKDRHRMIILRDLINKDIHDSENKFTFQSFYEIYFSNIKQKENSKWIRSKRDLETFFRRKHSTDEALDSAFKRVYCDFFLWFLRPENLNDYVLNSSQFRQIYDRKGIPLESVVEAYIKHSNSIKNLIEGLRRNLVKGGLCY